MNLGKILVRVRPHVNVSNGVLLVAGLIALSWVWSAIDSIQKNFHLQQQVDILQQEITVAELENRNLQFQKKYYESDEYLELSARERLNKAAPGEKLIILPPNKAEPSKKDTFIGETPISERSNFAQWMYFLFGKKS